MAVDAETIQAALIGYKSEQERITKAIADMRAQLKGRTAPVGSPESSATPTKPKHKLSAAARKRIAAAQKK